MFNFLTILSAIVASVGVFSIFYAVRYERRRHASKPKMVLPSGYMSEGVIEPIVCDYTDSRREPVHV